MALSNMFSDLHFAVYICLLVHCCIDMQTMTIDLKSVIITAKLGLSRSNEENQVSKYMTINHRPDAPIILHGKEVQEVKEFSYLSSKMTSDGDAGSEINVRIFKTGDAGECYGLGGRQKTGGKDGLWQWPYAHKGTKKIELC